MSLWNFNNLMPAKKPMNIPRQGPYGERNQPLQTPGKKPMVVPNIPKPTLKSNDQYPMLNGPIIPQVPRPTLQSNDQYPMKSPYIVPRVPRPTLKSNDQYPMLNGPIIPQVKRPTLQEAFYNMMSGLPPMSIPQNQAPRGFGGPMVYS